MASLTSARARNRGGHGATSPIPSASQDEHWDNRITMDDDSKGLDKSGLSTSSSNYPPAHQPSSSPSLLGDAATSGWITSGQQQQGHSSSSSSSNSKTGKGAKGKGRALTGNGSSSDYVDKAGSHGRDGHAVHHLLKSGGGPLRFYGGGLGVVGPGEFKLLLLVTLLASVVRLWRLDRPASVVFDEVHFGGFATKYIKQKFFMDVHPPLAKLLITFAAWFAGFRGNFDFKDIGKEYGPDHVPYIAMRLLPASLGVALVPIAYLTLRSLGCRPATALLASLLLTFENGLITQSRLILLDSELVFFTGLTTFLWVGFSAEDARRAGSSGLGPFSRVWWAWLALAGTSLGATLSCKWVGLLTIATIGLATLEQLWSILGDTRVPMKTLARHFVARALCLIVIPSVVYMFWFWIHFQILHHSGDGDGFMSSEFQHTLQGHGMEDTYADVLLGSRVTVRHVNTQGGYLHSHPHNYPGGSKQQQITLYPHKDENNEWLLLNETQQVGKESDPRVLGPTTYVTDKMFLRLHHPTTSKKLHSHDVRPSVSEVDFQNEVSAYGFPDFEGDANDNFQIEIENDATDRRDRYAKKRVRALRTKFRLRHVLTGCYLFSHKVKLPDWGFEQQEVTCNKNPTKANSIWYIETNTHPLLPERAEKINYRRPSFFSKFWELQGVMWRTNAGLTDRHAYDSRPHHWPYLRRGINFWVKDHRQVYLIGNPVTWWISSLSVLMYAAARGFIIIRAKRGYQDLNNTTVSFYDRLCGFLFIGWALHYFPFFIMQRQLFLHHYFPALYYSLLLFASVFDLATSTLKPKFRVQMAAIVLVCALWAYAHWSPLTYAGRWTKKDCEDSKWLKNWDFSCNDFHAKYSDYDNVILPTPSKPVVHVGSGRPSGVAPVEAETPSDAETVVEPAKNAFLDENEPPPAPKSRVGDAALFAQAEAAHSSAEQKEEAEHTELERVKETEPTRLPGADLPAAVVESRVKKEVEEEINREAPVPLEEAGPTPEDDDKADAAQQTVAAIADPEVKAGAQKMRLAKIDDDAVRAGVNAPADLQAQVDAAEANELRGGGAPDLAAQDGAVEQEQKLEQEQQRIFADAGAAEDAYELPVAPAPAVENDAPQDPVEPVVAPKNVPLDADAQAAMDERERFNREQEAEAIAGGAPRA